MGSLPVRALRCVGVWVLLALLAVPLAASGHHHEPLRTAADCTQCAAVGSLSAASLHAAPQITFVVCAYAHQPLSQSAPDSVFAVAHAARAPPLADSQRPA
jgi:hypothetical protein